MKILRLTTSNELIHQGPGSRLDWLTRLGSEQLGEPVEIVSKTVWPDARLPKAVERWVADEQPDLVWMMLQSFWFEYRSVPKKLSRKFGRAGKVASDIGFKAADRPRIANNSVFRTGRRLLQRTVGGDAHFTTADLYATVESIARISLRDEGRQFVVWGPFSYSNFSVTKKEERDTDRARTALIGRVRALSRDLHFYHEAPDRPRWATDGEVGKHSDGFHHGADEQRQMAEREIATLLRIVRGPATDSTPEISRPVPRP